MKKQIDYNGLPLSYSDEGTGSVIVLLHGFAEDSSVWQQQTAFLVHSYRVIVPDIPGSGLSAYNPSLVCMEDFAEVVHALLAHENIARCILLGHSMGGYITLAFANKHPQRLQGFGLVHSTAFADSEEKKQTRQKGIKFMEEHGAFAFIQNTTPNLFAAAYKTTSPEKILLLVEKGKTFKKEALQQYYRAMMGRPDLTEVLNNSKVPILFIAGAADVAVPLSDLLKQAHMPLTAFFFILEDSGHMGLWEQRDKTNENIGAFAAYITMPRE